jgi:uncharacterized membrane protein YphA (DoxX/SURF4 family)
MSNASSTPAQRGGLESIVLLVVRLAIGGLFAFSAWNKLYPAPDPLLPSGPQQFALAMKSFALLPDHLVMLMAFVVPWCELLCAALLILGFWTRANAFLLLAMLVSFTLAVASVIARQMNITCGCFGSFHLLCKGPISTCKIIENCVLMLPLLLLLARGPGRVALTQRG